ELHQQQQPLPLPRLDAKGLTADQLREVARALEISIPSVDSGLEKSYGQARARLEVAQHSSESKLLVAALAATAVIVGAGSPQEGASTSCAGLVGRANRIELRLGGEQHSHSHRCDCRANSDEPTIAEIHLLLREATTDYYNAFLVHNGPRRLMCRS